MTQLRLVDSDQLAINKIGDDMKVEQVCLAKDGTLDFEWHEGGYACGPYLIARVQPGRWRVRLYSDDGSWVFLSDGIESAHRAKELANMDYQRRTGSRSDGRT